MMCIEMWDSYGGCEVYNNSFFGGSTLDIAGSHNVKGSYPYSWWIHDNIFKLSEMHPATDNPHVYKAVEFESTNEDFIVEYNLFENFGMPLALTIGMPDNHISRGRISYNIFKNSGNTDKPKYADIYCYAMTANAFIEDIDIENNIMYQRHNAAAGLHAFRQKK